MTQQPELQQLAAARKALVAAGAAYQDWLAACIAAGHDSGTIAAAIGCTPHNVRMSRLWRKSREAERDTEVRGAVKGAAKRTPPSGKGRRRS